MSDRLGEALAYFGMHGSDRKDLAAILIALYELGKKLDALQPPKHRPDHYND